MEIMPKIADKDVNNIENIKDYLEVSTKLEVQMLDKDLNKSFEQSIGIVEKFPTIKYLVLHVPFYMLNICFIQVTEKYRRAFMKLIIDSIKYSMKNDIAIDILFHVNMRIDEYVSIGGIEFLKYIDSLVEGTQVGFLLENSIIDVNMDDDELPNYANIFKLSEYKNIRFCLDLCHFQSSEYLLSKDISLDNVLLKNLKNIHFSMTLNYDGWKNKLNTHGRGHTSKRACFEDLEYLKKKGVNLEKVNIVTEISEEDYKKRPDMHKELYYLKE